MAGTQRIFQITLTGSLLIPKMASCMRTTVRIRSSIPPAGTSPELAANCKSSFQTPSISKSWFPLDKVMSISSLCVFSPTSIHTRFVSRNHGPIPVPETASISMWVSVCDRGCVWGGLGDTGGGSGLKSDV